MSKYYQRIFKGFFFFLFSLHLYGCSAPSVEVAFSPSPEAGELVEATVDSAEHSIDAALTLVRSKSLTKSLIAAQRRGVQVRVILEKRELDEDYYIDKMQKKGILVHIASRYFPGDMHDKYIIVDNKTVQTGSFNYKGKSIKRNAEDVIVIKDDTAIAAKYHEDWQKIWDQSTEYKAD